MAMNILRMVAACWASLESNSRRSSFGDAVDDRGHLLAELLGQPLGGHAGVLHGVVQQGGGDGRLVEPQVGHDARDGDGVRDVRARPCGEAALVGVDGREARATD